MCALCKCIGHRMCVPRHGVYVFELGLIKPIKPHVLFIFWGPFVPWGVERLCAFSHARVYGCRLYAIHGTFKSAAPAAARALDARAETTPHSALPGSPTRERARGRAHTRARP